MINTFKKHICISLMAAATTFANITTAATPVTRIDIETGTEYDSNLSIIELDRSSSENDWALLANARVNSQWQATKKLKLKGGLGYNSKTYQDYSAYDLAIKQAFIDAGYDFEALTLGISYHHADASLDSRDFLTLQQRSLYVSRLFNQRTFLRAAINEQDKDFPTSGLRNADNRGLAGDAFFFYNQGKTFFTVGVSSEEENAVAREFDYDGINLRASINHQFLLWNKKNRLQFSLRHDERDYSGITPAIEARRKDKRNIITTEWQVETNRWLTIAAKLERGNYDSNLHAANYSETLGSVMLKASF